MGTCSYCGKDAGWFRKEHSACKDTHDEARMEIVTLLIKALNGGIDLATAEQSMHELAAGAYISAETKTDLILRAYESATDDFLADGHLSDEEHDRAGEYIKYFNMDRSLLAENPAHLRIVKTAILQDLLAGDISARYRVSGDLPFNFQKSESLVWLLQDCEYHQLRTRTSYRGTSSGVSVSVAKGISYRVGGYSGEPVATTSLIHIDTGGLAITTKHLYFAGRVKSVRIPYSKIISFRQYADALGVQRDNIQSPDIFMTDDPQFLHDLVSGLVRRVTP